MTWSGSGAWWAGIPGPRSTSTPAVGGEGPLPDITRRLAGALEKRIGRPDVETWLAAHATLEGALAETLTLAADDVLLDELLARLETVPGARRLLIGASVYREPVEVNALVFQLGEADPTAGHTPAYQDAERAIGEIVAAAGQDPEYPDAERLPPPALEQLAPHLAVLRTPPTAPRRPATELASLVEACEAASLLTVAAGNGAATYVVHRWTAAELEGLWKARGRQGKLTAAHRAAAEYWRWRFEFWPQDLRAGIHDLLEARHHLLAAGSVEEAGLLTEGICLQLDTWGAWGQEEA